MRNYLLRQTEQKECSCWFVVLWSLFQSTFRRNVHIRCLALLLSCFLPNPPMAPTYPSIKVPSLANIIRRQFLVAVNKYIATFHFAAFFCCVVVIKNLNIKINLNKLIIALPADTISIAICSSDACGNFSRWKEILLVEEWKDNTVPRPFGPECCGLFNWRQESFEFVHKYRQIFAKNT